MKKYFASNLLILILILSSGCQTSPETVETPITKVPTANTAPNVTLEPSPTATVRVMSLEENVDAFRSGEIDFPSGLTTERSVAFINEMENQRGAQPIFFKITDGSIWFMADENFLKNHPELSEEIIEQRNRLYHAGGDFLEEHPDIAKEITPEKDVPGRMDPGSGNLQYMDRETREWVTLQSLGRDPSVIINKDNIKQAISENWLEWPTLNLLGAEEGEFAGMTGLQAMIAGYDKNKNYEMVLGYLEKNAIEQIPIHFKQGGWDEEGFLSVLVAITDDNGEFLHFRRVYVGPAGGTTFRQEGSDLDQQSSIRFLNDEWLFEQIGLKAGNHLWMILNTDQESIWENNELAEFGDLDGVVPAEDSFDNLTGKKADDGSLLVGAGWIISGKE